MPELALMPHYLNTAAFGLIAPQVKAQADAFYTELAERGSSVAEHWRDTTQPQIRTQLAAFLGTTPGQVAMLPNFSWGLNAVVAGLKGSETVLLSRGDYASVSEPFLLNAFAIHWVESADDFTLPVDAILQAIHTRKVQVVALSHVQYNSGFVLDLERIGTACREAGVWFIVDATQSLGALQLDVSTLPVDVLISSHYKWMNAGFGTGSMYCSGAFLKEYPPKTGGANSYAKAGEYWLEAAPVRGFEPGHTNMYGLSLMHASIREKLHGGVAAIAAHNSALTSALLSGLGNLGLPLIGPLSMDDRCSILVFHDRDGLSERLRKAEVTATIRGGRVRLSLHHYNTMEDVAAAIEALTK